MAPAFACFVLLVLIASGRFRAACWVGADPGVPRARRRPVLLLTRPAPCEGSGMATFRAEQFDVRVSDEVLADLRARILNTRLLTPRSMARRTC